MLGGGGFNFLKKGFTLGLFNVNSGWGAALFRGQINDQVTTGRIFMVADGSTPEANYNSLADLYKPYPDGVLALYNTITAALAACTAGRGDKILLSPGFTTAPTLTELATCATKGVMMEQAGGKLGDSYVTLRATSLAPATTSVAIFTVTAPIRLLDIQGEVTEAFEARANSAVLAAVPTVGASTNLCTTLDINALATGTILGITGTLSTVMQSNANGVLVSQAAPITIPAGVIKLANTANSAQGKIRWQVRYQPLSPGARVFAA